MLGWVEVLQSGDHTLLLRAVWRDLSVGTSRDHLAGTGWSGGRVAGLQGGGVLHHLELAGVVVAGVHGEVRASARARGNLGACGLARVCVGGRRGGREEGGGEGLLVQQEVCRIWDRRCHELARVVGGLGLYSWQGCS